MASENARRGGVFARQGAARSRQVAERSAQNVREALRRNKSR